MSIMDILPNVLVRTTIVTDRDVFNFYSNRSIMRFPRSSYTIANDIPEQLNLSYSDAKSTLAIIKTYSNNIASNIGDVKQSDINDFIKCCEETLVTDTYRKIADLYDKISSIDSTAVKFLYRARHDSSIFSFIDAHKHLLPLGLTDTVLKYIPSIPYCNKSMLIDTHIKRCVTMNLICALFPESVLRYYNLYRFNYLYTLIHNGSLSPIYYDKYTGWLYFDVLYNKMRRKEQIIEEVHANPVGFGTIAIDEVFTFVHYRSKEFTTMNNDCTIAKCKSKYGAISKRETCSYIDDTFSSYDCCNVIRKVLSVMIGIRNYKRNLPSMYELLGRVIKLHPMAIDYSRISELVTTGDSTYLIPIDGNDRDEITLTDHEMYSKYSRKDIKIEAFINRYSRLLHNTYNTLIAVG